MPESDVIDLDAATVASGMLKLLSIWLWIGLSAALVARSRRAKKVGRELAVESGDGRLGRLLTAMVVAGFALGSQSNHGPDLYPLAFASVLALVLIRTCARPGEGRAGEEGMSIGWEAWAWREVSSWRLLGEHLRIEVDGRWLALRVDRETLGVLERHLIAQLPERRSFLS